VDQELLLRNEYLAAENRILKAKLKGPVRFSGAERARLGEIGHRLGRKVLGEVATVARPDTILAWYRRLVARKFDGSKARRTPGRPRVDRVLEELIVRMAKENPDWGYDRIVGALANLGYEISDQTVGNILQRHGLPPVPERKHTTTWPAFIRTHLALCWRGPISSRRKCSRWLVSGLRLLGNVGVPALPGRWTRGTAHHAHIADDIER
jgi:putative transposase